MVIAAIWKNDIRHFLFALNVVAFTILIVGGIYILFSRRRAGRELEKAPANLTPFLKDDELEGRRLERVQGWALIFAAIIAIALPIYWLREPTRQNQSSQYFANNAVSRGATLFASPGTEDYNAAVSKQCANCHGEKGAGGVATARINGVPVQWKAPPLNTELLRFSQDEVRQIITYGRPGTPMQGWGVLGGGPLNDQGISDLIAFINSLQLDPKVAQEQAMNNLAIAKGEKDGACPEYATCPDQEVATAKKSLDTANAALTKAKADPQIAKLADPTAECEAVKKQVEADTSSIDRAKAIACGTYLTALQDQKDAQAAYDWSLDWQKRRADVSDGQMLFEMNCARCHTEGWSVFNPASPPDAVDGVNILGLSGGGGGANGGSGFNLRDGGEVRRFGDDDSGGFQSQVAFVTTGSEDQKPYGRSGIGTGRMPGFGSMLTPEQINQIVAYERTCIAGTTYTGVTPACLTPTKAPAPTTTTTTVAKG
jgi:mono/diheme cytochrome c family protein